MADFTPNTNVKSAVRRLASPIADITAFNLLVQSVLTDNPFGCVSYMSAGVNHPPVEKSRESYTAKFVYEDNLAKRVGAGSETYSTVAGFSTGIAAVIANSANITAHGGTPVHDGTGDNFSATLRVPRSQWGNVLPEHLPGTGLALVLHGRLDPCQR